MDLHLKDAASASGTPEHSVDALVTGTVNAPYKRAIHPEVLADCLASGDVQDWLVHVATFFTDVRPGLVLSFASRHGIDAADLLRVYHAVKAKTGERNIELEAELGTMAWTARASGRRSGGLEHRGSDENDPLIAAFLAFVERDAIENPHNVSPLTQEQMDRLRSLKKGIQVSDDDVISDDVTF